LDALNEFVDVRLIPDADMHCTVLAIVRIKGPDRGQRGVIDHQHVDGELERSRLDGLVGIRAHDPVWRAKGLAETNENLWVKRGF